MARETRATRLVEVAHIPAAPARFTNSVDLAITPEQLFEVLADAERRGNVRPIARTPLQFATALRSEYGSDVPAEISERFSRLRYGGVDSPHADVARLEQAWLLLKEQP